MGNEGSLPQGHHHGEDELEHQARAPPSSTNPPLNNGSSHTASSAAAATQRAGGRMINAVFHRRNNQNHQSQQHQYSPNDYMVNGDGIISDDMMMMMTPEQQMYYAQQQQQQQQQKGQFSTQQNPDSAYSQQQQQQTMYYQQHPDQQQFNASSSSQEQQGVAGVFSASGAASSGSTKKSGMSFRPTGRGAAIINSMRNLSLTNPMNRGASSNPSRSAAKGATVNDWETKWDEDDDSEGEDDVKLHGPTPVYGGGSGGAAMPLHPQMMTSNTQGLGPGPVGSPPGQYVPATSHHQQQQYHHQYHQNQHQQQQQMHPASVTPTKEPIASDGSSSNIGLNNSSSSMSHDAAAAAASLPHGGVVMPARSAEDGVEWDTGAAPQTLPAATAGGAAVIPVHEGDVLLYEKPNVQMFLPLLRVLGKGSFGKVVLVQKRVGKERGALFAMKILRKSHLVKRRQIERTRTERKVLSVVNHPFIMKLHYAFQSPDKLYLVLDYCPGGELFFHLSRFRRFPERVARFYAAELLLALGHLHKRGIIYRDLKPENVLLDADGHVKLGDFGLAKAGIKHACEGASSMCGTPEYMAPEVLAQQGHGFCVDYWGLGMLVYEMMTGLPPWYTTDRAKLFRRLRSAPLDIPSYFSQASANCVSALLERNPRRRLGVTGIRAAMEHDFFRSISWRALYGRRVEAPIRPCEGWSPPEAVSDEPDVVTVNTSQDNSSNHSGSSMKAQQHHQQHQHMNLHHYQQSPQNNSNSSLSVVSAGGNSPAGGGGGATGGIENLDSSDLDAATANFDNTFTRMPVETDDGQGHGADGNGDDEEFLEELNEDTFVGFTFDDTDRNDLVSAGVTQSSSANAGGQRQRTHPQYVSSSGGGTSGHSSQSHQQYAQQQQQQQNYHPSTNNTNANVRRID